MLGLTPSPSLNTHDDDAKAVAGVGEGEEEETYSLGSVGHIFQFLQHNHIYGETVRAVGRRVGVMGLVRRRQGLGLGGCWESHERSGFLASSRKIPMHASIHILTHTTRQRVSASPPS